MYAKIVGRPDSKAGWELALESGENGLELRIFARNNKAD